jgi:hypothetical protein
MSDVKPLRDSKGFWLPGQRGGGGRARGSLNKTTKNVKQAIESVFEGLGGTDEFLRWAQENKGIFYERIFIRLLPLHLKADIAPVDIAELLAKARQRAGNVIDVSRTDDD